MTNFNDFLALLIVGWVDVAMLHLFFGNFLALFYHQFDKSDTIKIWFK
jgi:hypothetical protein